MDIAGKVAKRKVGRREENRKRAFLALEVRKIRIEGRIATMMRRRLREASRNARLRW